MNKAIIFSAPSGAGKTTIVHKLMQTDLPVDFSISATNRLPRSNEKNGKDYFFLSEKEFQNKINNNEFFEWEEVYENICYGTLWTEMNRVWQNNKAIIFDVDVKGGLNLKNKLNDSALAIFINPPSIKILENRLRMRLTETEESLRKRIARASFELEFVSKFDVIIINDDLEKATIEAYDAVLDFLNKK